MKIPLEYITTRAEISLSACWQQMMLLPCLSPHPLLQLLLSVFATSAAQSACEATVWQITVVTPDTHTQTHRARVHAAELNSSV